MKKISRMMNKVIKPVKFTTRLLTLTQYLEICLDHDGLARHDHAVLKIFINGQQELIPANIGIMTEICNQQGEEMHLYILMIVLAAFISSLMSRSIFLLEYFLIFGVIISMKLVFLSIVNSTHELIMTVGDTVIDSYDDYLLVNTSEVIEIRYQLRVTKV